MIQTIRGEEDMRTSSLHLTLLALFGFYAPGALVGQEPKVDRHGDPLPPDALVRIGTIRLRQPHPQTLFSADGKTLISAGADHTVRTWDVATGKYLGGKPLEAT